MNRLKIAYFGSPDFAADFLERLITDTTINKLIEVKLVVAQPDQKVGRKQILTPTPVKMISLKFENLIIENSLKIENLKLKISQTDLALVYAFGDLIPNEFLSLPKYGFWNIHPSLLPKYRGPSPIATLLINGDKTTGVTIIKMDDSIDHGPIIAQENLTIENDDKRLDLETKLTNLAFEMLKKLIKTGVEGLGIPTAHSRGILSEASTGGKRHETGPVFRLTEQNHQEATYTKKLTKHDGFVPFENLKLKIENSPEVLYNLFRGLYPWPGIWSILPNGKRLKITDMKLTGKVLMIKKVQLEGKTEVDFPTFNKAYNIF